MALENVSAEKVEAFVISSKELINQSLEQARAIKPIADNFFEIQQHLYSVEGEVEMLTHLFGETDQTIQNFAMKVASEIKKVKKDAAQQVVNQEMRLAERAADSATWSNSFEISIMRAKVAAEAMAETLDSLGYPDRKIYAIRAEGAANGVFMLSAAVAEQGPKAYSACPDDYEEDYSKSREAIRKKTSELFSSIQLFATDLNLLGQALNENAQKDGREFSDLGDITAARILGPKRTAALLQAAETMQMRIEPIRAKLTKPAATAYLDAP